MYNDNLVTHKFSLWDHKEALQSAIDDIDDYINMWPENYKIYEVTQIPAEWVLILLTNEKFFVVLTNEKTLKNMHDRTYRKSNKQELIKNLKKFEEPSFRILYKTEHQQLVGYLLDFFIYYVDLPKKIINVISN